jgi:group I intron endonuclease
VNTQKPKYVKEYLDLEKDKKFIKEENRGKAGVYELTNLKNNKRYVGSSINLRERLSSYLCPGAGKRKFPIYKALGKYGLKGFKLSILKYCAKDEVLV